LILCALASLWAGYSGSILILVLPAVGHQFGSSIGSLANLGSVLSLGTALAPPLGWAADRIGRRPLLALALALGSAADLFSALSTGLTTLALSRLLAVGLETLALTLASALVVEEVVATRRGLALAGLGVSAGIGFGLATIIYPALAPNWRALYWGASLGLPLAGLVFWQLPESRLWAAAAQGSAPLRQVLSGPWRRRLWLACGFGILSAALYRPAALLIAFYGSRDLHLEPIWISAVIVVSGVVSAPALLLGGTLSDRWGRRRPGVLLGLLAAAFTALNFSLGRAGYWVGSVGASLGSSAQAPVLGAWFGELFPTRARASAESLTAFAAALGGIAGLQILPALQSRLGLGGAIAILALPALAGSLLLLGLPETQGLDLPE